MTYVRKTKWHPISEPVIIRRSSPAIITRLQHHMTLSYWREWFLQGNGRISEAQERERISNELIRQAGLPV